MGSGAHAARMSSICAAQSLLMAERASIRSPLVDLLTAGQSGGTHGRLPAPRSMLQAHSKSTATLVASSGPVCGAASGGAGTTGVSSNAPGDGWASPVNPARRCTSSLQGCTSRRSEITDDSGTSTPDVGDGELQEEDAAAAHDAPAAPE
eukprot:5197732-Prymnesium_polylepis.1